MSAKTADTKVDTKVDTTVATKKATSRSKSKAGKTTATPKRRHYLPAAERKKQILKAARAVFARSGLSGARTRELAKEAGINQATLFEHFSSKEELFVAAVMEPMIALIEDQQERAKGYAEAETHEDLMGLLQTGMQRNLEGTIEIFPILVQALFSDQMLGKKLYKKNLQPLMEIRSEMMKTFIAEEFDPSLVQMASFGMFFALAMEQHLTGKKRNTAEAAKQLSDLMLFGCSNQPRPNH